MGQLSGSMIAAIIAFLFILRGSLYMYSSAKYARSSSDRETGKEFLIGVILVVVGAVIFILAI